MKGLFSRRRFVGRIDPTHGDLLLFACCFVTGLIDCAAFQNYKAFAGMMTGNTVILFLSTAGYPTGSPYIYGVTLVSLCSFFVGCFVTARISHAAGPLRRGVIACDFLAQGLLIVLAGILVALDIIPSNPQDLANIDDNPRIIAALPALAFQSGSTMAVSRALGFSGEIPVNVLTSTYAALAADPKLFHRDNPPRNRRVVACVCVALGALCAAWIQRAGAGASGVFWLSAAVKLALVPVVWLLFPHSKEEAERLSS